MRSIAFRRRFRVWTSFFGVILIGLVYLFPVYWLVTLSLKTQREAFKTPPDLLFTPTFQHYARLFVRENFFRFFYNSAVTAVMATTIAIIVGVTGAYALSRGGFRGKRAILFGVLATQMAPPILFVVPYFRFLGRLGLIDTYLALVIVYLGPAVALVTWSMRVFFDDLPIELEEAARIDGASDLQTFLRVVLPLVSSGAVATGIFAMILTWNQFLLPLVITRGRAVTAPVAVMRFVAQESEDYGLLASGAIILTLPVVVFNLLIRKFLTGGLTAGAVKG